MTMAQITIFVSDDDVAAAKRISARMFPKMPGYLDAQHVVASAARIGMEQFKVAWGDKPEAGKTTKEGFQIVNGPSISESEDARRDA
jgi:hypothetical protein